MDECPLPERPYLNTIKVKRRHIWIDDLSVLLIRRFALSGQSILGGSILV